jgi:hypothetical protein
MLEHHISRPRPAGNLDRLISVEGDLDAVAEESQQACDALGRIPILVDDEDPGEIDTATR